MASINSYRFLMLLSAIMTGVTEWSYEPVVISKTEVALRWRRPSRRHYERNVTDSNLFIEACTVITGCVDHCLAERVDAANGSFTVAVDLRSRRLLMKVFHEDSQLRPPVYEHEFSEKPEEPNPPCDVTWSRDAYGGVQITWSPALGLVDGYEVRLCGDAPRAAHGALWNSFMLRNSEVGFFPECHVGCPSAKHATVYSNRTQVYLTDVRPFLPLNIEVRSFRKDLRREVHHSVASSNVHRDRLITDVFLSSSTAASYLLLGNPVGFLVVLLSLAALVAVAKWTRRRRCSAAKGETPIDIALLAANAHPGLLEKTDVPKSAEECRSKTSQSAEIP